MMHRGADDGPVGGAADVGRFEAAAQFNQSDFINLSTLTMRDGSGPASVTDEAAGSRGARIGRANRGKGEDHTCAFS